MAGEDLPPGKTAADAAYEAWLAKYAQKSAEYRRRGWYSSLHYDDVLDEKAALENRLRELRSGQIDFEGFNGAVRGCERLIEAIFSDPVHREPPFVAVFNRDPLK